MCNFGDSNASGRGGRGGARGGGRGGGQSGRKEGGTGRSRSAYGARTEGRPQNDRYLMKRAEELNPGNGASFDRRTADNEGYTENPEFPHVKFDRNGQPILGFSCHRRGRPVGYVAVALARLQGGAAQPRIAADFNDDYAALAVPDEDGSAAAADARPPAPSTRGGRGGGRGGAVVAVPRAGGDGYGPQKPNVEAPVLPRRSRSDHPGTRYKKEADGERDARPRADFFARNVHADANGSGERGGYYSGRRHGRGDGSSAAAVSGGNRRTPAADGGNARFERKNNAFATGVRGTPPPWSGSNTTITTDQQSAVSGYKGRHFAYRPGGASAYGGGHGSARRPG
ncbi:hypothetical protein AAVH_04778 [Aphelenchoides avenae]|nr:hypothetical protein AAVH_04778 [Aphelenchus avenae]